MRKFISTILSVFVLLSIFNVGIIFNKPIKQASATTTTTKEIDVYFISGQSTAAGETYYNTLTTTKPEYTSGYQNIYLHGSAMNAGDTKQGRSFSYPTLVNGNMGNYNGRFGPELGMAEYLSTYYNTATGKEAIFIKYACGAASLDGQPGTGWGNFCPPSKLSESTVVGENLYNNLINTIKDALNTLKNNGYTNVNYKGMFWAQGAAEMGNYSRAIKYGSYLEAFIYDFRSDLFEITKPYFGVNAGATTLPFAINEVSPYFNNATVYEGSDGLIHSNNKNIEVLLDQQRTTATKVPYAETVYIGNYIVNQTLNPGCKDPYHLCGDDNLDLGNRVGKILYERTAKGLVCAITGNSNVDTIITQKENTDGSVTVNWSNGGTFRRVKSVIFKNQDITSLVSNNTYTIDKDDIGEVAYFVVEYEKYKSTLTKNISTEVYIEYSVTNANDIYDNGTVIKFKPYWRPDSSKKDTYKLSRVAFNNVGIYKDADGYYSITLTDDSVLALTITKFGNEYDGGMEVYNGVIPEDPVDTPTNPSQPSNPGRPTPSTPTTPDETPNNGGDKGGDNGGCASNISTESSILFVVSLLSLAVVYFVTKKALKK